MERPPVVFILICSATIVSAVMTTTATAMALTTTATPADPSLSHISVTSSYNQNVPSVEYCSVLTAEDVFDFSVYIKKIDESEFTKILDNSISIISNIKKSFESRVNETCLQNSSLTFTLTPTYPEMNGAEIKCEGSTVRGNQFSTSVQTIMVNPAGVAFLDPTVLRYLDDDDSASITCAVRSIPNWNSIIIKHVPIGSVFPEIIVNVTQNEEVLVSNLVPRVQLTTQKVTNISVKITFTSVECTDEGLYICEVTNDIDNETKKDSTEFVLYRRPSNLDLSLHIDQVENIDRAGSEHKCFGNTGYPSGMMKLEYLTKEMEAFKVLSEPSSVLRMMPNETGIGACETNQTFTFGLQMPKEWDQAIIRCSIENPLVLGDTGPLTVNDTIELALLSTCNGTVGNVFKSNFYNCSRFIHCYNGYPYVEECQHGLYFGIIKSTGALGTNCDYENNVLCEKDITTFNIMNKTTTTTTVAPYNEDIQCTDQSTFIGSAQVIINCNVSISANHNLTVNRRDQQIAFIIEDGTVTDDGVTDISVTLATNVSPNILQIIIYNVKCADEGDYIVTPSNGLSTRATLKVKKKPKGSPTLTLPLKIIENEVWHAIPCSGNIGYPKGRLKFEIKMSDNDTFTEIKANSSSYQQGNCTFNSDISLILTRGLDMNGSVIRCSVENNETFEVGDADIMSSEEILYVIPKSVCINASADKYRYHLYDCNKYIRCVNGIAYVLKCQVNYYFDVSQTACTGSKNQCPANTVMTTTTMAPTTTARPPESVCINASADEYRYHPYDCNKFIRCVNGIGYVLTCPVNKYFDFLHTACTNSKSQCPANTVMTTTTMAPTTRARPPGITFQDVEVSGFINTDFILTTCILRNMEGWSTISITKESTVIFTVNSGSSFDPNLDARINQSVFIDGNEMRISLNFTSVVCSDEGIYTCSVHKASIVYNATMKMSVKRMPASPILNLHANQVENSSIVGSNHKCKAYVGYPGGSLVLKIRKNVDTVLQNLADSNLLITRSRDTTTENCSNHESLEFGLKLTMDWDQAEIVCLSDNQAVLPNGQPPSDNATIQLIPGTYCDGKINGDYSHPSNCSRYVQCFSNDPYGKSCSINTCFDESLKYCNWCYDVVCDPTIITATTMAPTTTEQLPVITITTMPPVITEKLPAITSTAVAQTTTEELPVISTTKQAPIRTEKSPVSSTAKMTSENTEIASTMAPTTKPNTPESLTVTVLIGTASGLTFIVAIIIAVVFGIKRRQYNLKNRKDNNYDDLQMGPYVNQGRDIGEAYAYMSICEQNKITRHRPFDLSDIYRIVMEMHEGNDFKFAKEFQDLENLSSNDQCMSATLQQNRQKNRHKKSLPFDKNRVKLLKPKNNYINASHLKKIGNDSNDDFIVTQYPLNNTIEDFWTMIWEQNVLVIVMLTSEKDSRSVNYDRYFPSEIQSSKQSGSINVKLMTKCFIQKTELSNIRLKKGKKYRIIKHFQSLGWNDVYDHTMQTELTELIHAVKSNVSLLDTTGPIVVHCGLGTGRSGVFIALYQLMDCIDDKSVDIFDMVLKMRESRMHLIENMRQYIFIHDCFLHMISENNRKQNAYLEHFTGDSYDYIDVQ